MSAKMGFTLENLKSLIAEIDSGSTEGIKEKIENCWRELWEKNKITISPRDRIKKTKNSLQR